VTEHGSSVIVAVAGEREREVSLPPEATYADVLDAVDLGVHEAAVLVDGRPVPEDAPVEAETVRVLRLIQGG
jgi:sulfur carrier protein